MLREEYFEDRNICEKIDQIDIINSKAKLRNFK
jgi:hypothetical protein